MDIDDKSSISTSSSSSHFSNVIHEGLGKRTTLKAQSPPRRTTGGEDDDEEKMEMEDDGEMANSHVGNNNNDETAPASTSADAMKSSVSPSASKTTNTESDATREAATLGPRIKHVCRKASVAKRQGSPAKFTSLTKEDDDNDVDNDVDKLDDDAFVDDSSRMAKPMTASMADKVKDDENSMEGSESSVEFCRLSALPRDEKDKVLEEATER